jgi:UDP-glucose 4-epimerase
VGDIFNIGNPEEVSILQLAQNVIELTGSRSPILTVPYEEAYESGFEDMPRRVPDINKINNLTGWSPTLSLSDILGRVVTHMKTI